jgi:hypothetical protein
MLLLWCFSLSERAHTGVQAGETVEWMGHPGFSCVQGHGDDFNAHPSRELERQAALSFRLPQGWELISYEDI